MARYWQLTSLPIMNKLHSEVNIGSKTNLVTFHHRGLDTELLQIRMNGCPLDRLVGLKLALDLKGNSYIRSLAKDVGKMGGSPYHSSEYLTSAILYLYKIQTKKCTDLTLQP